MNKLRLSEEEGGLPIESRMWPTFVWLDPAKYEGPNSTEGLLRGSVLVRVRDVFLPPFVVAHSHLLGVSPYFYGAFLRNGPERERAQVVPSRVARHDQRHRTYHCVRRCSGLPSRPRHVVLLLNFAARPVICSTLSPSGLCGTTTLMQKTFSSASSSSSSQTPKACGCARLLSGGTCKY